MSGGSYFEYAWTILTTSWTLSEDEGSGYVSRGTVTITAGTRTTTGHMAALVTALNAAAGVVGVYTLVPWAGAPEGERPSQRWSFSAAGAITRWRLTSPTGSADALGLGSTVESVDNVIAPLTWIRGIWAPPRRCFHDDRYYQENKQSHTQTYNRKPLIIRHSRRSCRNFMFRFVPGRFVRGDYSPNADSAQFGIYGSFEAMWQELAVSGDVYYWPDFDDTTAPDLNDAVLIALESQEQAASLSTCLDDEAWSSFGRDAHHVMFKALEVGL